MQTKQANQSAPSATEFDLEQTKWKMNSPVSMDEPPAALIAGKKLHPTSICRFLAISQINSTTAITAAAMGGIEMPGEPITPTLLSLATILLIISWGSLAIKFLRNRHNH